MSPSHSSPFLPTKMHTTSSFHLLLLILILITAPFVSPLAVVGVGVGVGVSIGSKPTGNSNGGGGGIWFGGGSTGFNAPSNTQSPTTSLKRAYTALQAWKSAITDDPNNILTTWAGPDVCSYTGVFCSDLDDYSSGLTSRIVSSIDLNRANLKGTLVKELGSLAELSLLHLNSNRFSGTVPESFRDLVELTELDLSNNLFEGVFPSVTLEIPNLIYLDIRFNSFTGQIPLEVFDRKLDAIFVNNNMFQGELPSNLGDSSASVINLANNRFSGGLPASLGYTNNALREILFMNNQITGCIPDGVGFFSDMQVFDVSYNSLLGNIPDSISCLEDIEVLNLGHNKLSGELPELVCSLKNLLNLTVSHNFFSGFSQDCAKLFLRSVGFDFSDNCIPGKGMQRPPPQCSSGGAPGGINCPVNGFPSPKPLLCGSFY